MQDQSEYLVVLQLDGQVLGESVQRRLGCAIRIVAGGAIGGDGGEGRGYVHYPREAVRGSSLDHR